jgi:hypothetical protein
MEKFGVSGLMKTCSQSDHHCCIQINEAVHSTEFGIAQPTLKKSSALKLHYWKNKNFSEAHPTLQLC